ncbi:MAG TPA: glycosyltransferase family 2 protein [bacterium]|uniref:Undecaprenyl-phosphate 4-deoxy-4-formamido-L-arabinose transferase n=1 Tax=candidate division TA06 bacterium ADurb.Bin417 TaxID=1852828 RepID=A0A1V5MLS5_UNCT6|nr:MAG: Undecaprenyl-phosphate 4-deoxy-4-formamido-L-arabinose transferase [candidate division TA06 bacterium ADurb.Bin417]HNQ35467.1 glycosyltransferase family 2 protein [bacterium]HNS48340.1 glycosyltransferase family 2 protein [bacterium]
MWRDRMVSVILPTYNEKDSIRRVVDEFFATGVVDEVIVVNNNAREGTSAEVARTRAREVLEPRQGYGAAIQRGFREARGELLVLSEPDGTFAAHDIFKLLAYSDDFEAVFGTRTTSVLIWAGANMGPLLKWGNWAVAKMLEFLFNTTTFTDVGCTMRLIKRPALEKIRSQFTVQREHFGPEMMILAVINRLRYIEVPVNYLPRVGVSSVTGHKWRTVQLALRMVALILYYRVAVWLGRKPRPVS